MKVTNPAGPRTLHPQLHTALAALRAKRGFDAATYADAKASVLNSYLLRHGLKAVVVAVSGGIDSAVVLGLAARAAQMPDSSIERIVPVLAPVFADSATNQDDALARGRAVAASCGQEAHVVDLSAVHAALKKTVDAAVGIHGEAWASGQLVAYARTPAFYYVTSLLHQEGLPAVLLGTTNRDEGAYLGYVGKASDGMVDVQLIADLHKSEVAALAAFLKLPAEVLDAVPAGDMYDGRHDEEVFGAPYDFVELYLGWRCLPQNEQRALSADWDPEASAQFRELADHLEHLHSYNAHKYLVGSPAVHLNLLQSAVPGGWTS